MRDRSVDIKEKKRRLCNTVTDLDVIKVCLLEREKREKKKEKPTDCSSNVERINPRVAFRTDNERSVI